MVKVSYHDALFLTAAADDLELAARPSGRVSARDALHVRGTRHQSENPLHQDREPPPDHHHHQDHQQ